MVLSKRHKLIFVHISKTAGTYITALLTPQLGFNDLIIGRNVRVIGNPILQGYYRIRRDRVAFQTIRRNSEHRVMYLKKHSFAGEIRDTLGPGFLSYRRIAVVRNPFDRAVSSYFYINEARGKMRNPVLETAFQVARQAPDFSRFIKSGALERFRDEHFFAPQTHYIDDHGASLVDHVLRFEQLSRDLEALFSQMGLASPARDRMNASRRRPCYREYYDATSMRIVARLYAADLERFGYDF